eukprot:3604594-Pyramimonas_sp.AAC.1
MDHRQYCAIYLIADWLLCQRALEKLFVVTCIAGLALGQPAAAFGYAPDLRGDLPMTNGISAP